MYVKFSIFGATENARHGSVGQQKIGDLKTQDLTLTDQITHVENTRPNYGGPMCSDKCTTFLTFCLLLKLLAKRNCEQSMILNAEMMSFS